MESNTAPVTLCRAVTGLRGRCPGGLGKWRFETASVTLCGAVSRIDRNLAPTRLEARRGSGADASGPPDQILRFPFWKCHLTLPAGSQTSEDIAHVAPGDGLSQLPHSMHIAWALPTNIISEAESAGIPQPSASA
jgi:hypothetical protein